ncbi:MULTISPECIES: AMP-binding protein [unclassified Beijerinckia]|uniref:phenylacetate--CoA ligase family protein n=1 Tax=unclassified Beijerinckia TaxID=2638183 RepID=UPI0008982B84|nr:MULTISPECIES: AMP-binding protein [unclassified Beijerinckia]MDH7796906.1 phenylacetate-CoA ligase [Beijerinckia sp. GAS462]SEC64669.1 phenylacetate-CoA ligase [Beijerinckia sp. 28-YEA-48]
MRDFRAVMTHARTSASGLRAQLKGVTLEKIKTRDDLAAIPVLRKSSLIELQGDDPPFGGLSVTKAAGFERLFVSPGPIFEPQGTGKDWWGGARALFAAGVKKGDIVLNCFSYHLTPGGHMMESAARALGCAVIPAGPSNTEMVVAAVAHYRPRAYCGTPDYLKILLDKGTEMKRDMSSVQRGLVSGAALPPSLREELVKRGINVRQCYATADLGIVAFETSAGKGRIIEGMMVNEGIIVEIVKPGTGEPVAEGEVGEVVVTRLCRDYPLLRFATGDLSAFLSGKSPCGRTNMRIRGWLGRADQTTKIKGMFVHPSQIAEIGRRFPQLGRLRLVVQRSNEQDTMQLHAETDSDDAAEGIVSALAEVTKLRGTVKLVKRGQLPNDGKVIADERPAP